MSVYLTPEQVLFLHHRLVEETGGLHGVRDLAMLLSALGRPQAGFGKEELYPDLFSKAAALLESLILNHPFVDGNKRTAIAAAAIFLSRNGCELAASNEEMTSFTLACAQAQIPLAKIAEWLKAHATSHP